MIDRRELKRLQRLGRSRLKVKTPIQMVKRDKRGNLIEITNPDGKLAPVTVAYAATDERGRPAKYDFAVHYARKPYRFICGMSGDYESLMAKLAKKGHRSVRFLP